MMNYDMQERLLAWCVYMEDGGLERPVDAIPFDLMRIDGEVDGSQGGQGDMVGLLLAIVAASDPATGRQAVGAICDDGPPVDMELEDGAVADAVVLAHLFSMWAKGVAAPASPHLTLRKALVTGEGGWNMTEAGKTCFPPFG